jgi:hypothetical protein
MLSFCSVPDTTRDKHSTRKINWTYIVVEASVSNPISRFRGWRWCRLLYRAVTPFTGNCLHTPLYCCCITATTCGQGTLDFYSSWQHLIESDCRMFVLILLLRTTTRSRQSSFSRLTCQTLY